MQGTSYIHWGLNNKLQEPSHVGHENAIWKNIITTMTSVSLSGAIIWLFH